MQNRIRSQSEELEISDATFWSILKLRYNPEPIRFNQAQEEPAPYLFSFPYTAISLFLTRLFFQKIRTQQPNPHVKKTPR